jgi:YHS domain-containing protein
VSVQQPTDLVCGMKVDPETAKVSVVGEASYYFCCERCQRTFDRKPALYIGTAPGR